MIVLRAIDARFARDTLGFEPLRFVLQAGEAYDLAQPSARAAAIAARMCAAIVKPSSGTIFVGEYETRLQSPQAKRRVGFVDSAGFEGDEHAFRCEVAFRADVWGLAGRAAQSRARDLLAALGDGAYARAIALALVPEVRIVVLDRPSDSFIERVRELAPDAGIVHTRVAVLQPPGLVADLAPAAT